MTVARLLDKRQIDIHAIADPYHRHADFDSNDSALWCYTGPPVFQNTLMHYLDNDAPVLDENSTAQDHTKFINLVHLFSELIRYDIFSHNTYMCALISRGDLSTVPGQKIKIPPSLTASSNLTTDELSSIKSESTPKGCNAALTPSNTPNPASIATGTPGGPMSIGTPLIKEEDRLPSMEFKPKIEELDDSNVDDDLDKILQNIKEDQQNAMDAPDSPKEETHHDR